MIDELIESNLRGRGGAFFPTGRKASFIPTPDKVAKPIYITVNADESEPGTFKDREIMLQRPAPADRGLPDRGARDPVEAASTSTSAASTSPSAESLQGALDAGARRRHPRRASRSSIHRGAGAYVCGEETGLLESLEGKRGQPRSKPPFPAIPALYASPTLINNVETITTMPEVLAVGPAEYAQIGAPPDSTGTRVFCLSGNVQRPGAYEAAARDHGART